MARILNLVAAPPNLRESPTPGDMQGDFHAWFDGGAQRIDTGTQTFFLEDGTKVFAAAPAMWISLIIEFPDGERVVVEQVRGRGCEEFPQAVRQLIESEYQKILSRASTN